MAEKCLGLFMKKKNWYKPKGYTHLSNKLSIRDVGFVNSYVSNPNTVKSHRFFPLLHKTIVEKKYKAVETNSQGKPIRKHYKIENGKRKTTAKFREIFYSNHLDAHVYSYYTQKILSPLYENILSANSELSKSIIAYRRIEVEGEDRCKCNIDFAYEVFEFIKSRQGQFTVFAFDIKKFFDSINHKKLKKIWYQLLDKNRKDLPDDHYNVYKSLVNFSYVELNAILKEFKISHPNKLVQKDIAFLVKDGLEFRERVKGKGLIKENPFRHKKTKEKMGIPQGTPMSAFLANLYMLDYDKKIVELMKSIEGIYRRYSDDILVICDTEDEETVHDTIVKSIDDFHLEIQETKTQTSRFINGRLCKGEKPVAYLGFEFDGKNIRLKSSSIAKYYRNLKRLIKIKATRAKRMKRKYNERGFVFRKQIYKAYSHLGANKSSNRKRNYLSYVNLAFEIMGDKAIKKQLSKSWSVIHSEINRQTSKHRLHNSQDSLNYYLGADFIGGEFEMLFK